MALPGIAMHVNIFRGKHATPNWRLLDMPEDKMNKLLEEQSRLQDQIEAVSEFLAGD